MSHQRVKSLEKSNEKSPGSRETGDEMKPSLQTSGASSETFENGPMNGAGDHPVLADDEALRPDKGTEDDFEPEDNPFQFTPGQFGKMFNPKSLGAFHALGGLAGLEKGLRSDRKVGLSVHEETINSMFFKSLAYEEYIALFSNLGQAPEWHRHMRQTKRIDAHISSRYLTMQSRRYEPNFECTLSGKTASSFPDMGAGANYVSKAYVDQQNLTIDKIASGIVRTANGNKVRTLGVVRLPFCFKNESTVHELEFNVVPKCIKDVVLGAPFLRLTETFTRFAHRVSRVLRDALSCRFRYLGAPQQRMLGFLNEEAVGALPDTGSDVMLISKEYATRRGFLINTSRAHCKLLEFADGSIGRTTGLVENVGWEYGMSFGQTYHSDFYVLDNLECDVLLSYDFLCDTDAFTKPQSCLHDFDENHIFGGDWSLSTITLRPDLFEKLQSLKSRFNTNSNAASKVSQEPASIALPHTGLLMTKNNTQAWQATRRKLLQRKEETDTRLSRLPAQQRELALANHRAGWEQDWQLLMWNRPQTTQPNVSSQHGIGAPMQAQQPQHRAQTQQARNSPTVTSGSTHCTSTNPSRDSGSPSGFGVYH